MDEEGATAKIPESIELIVASEKSGDSDENDDCDDDQVTNKDQAEVDFEKTLDEVVERGDVNKIKKLITPTSLSKCKTNILEKSFEVSYKLKCLAETKGTDAEEIDDLSRSVEDFALELIEPLKTKFFIPMYEDIEENIDYIAERSITYRQKKFLSHPMVYNLLMKNWTGRFHNLRQSPCMTFNFWTWILLNIWTILDVVLFPLVFVIVYALHRMIKFLEYKQDHATVLVLNSTSTSEWDSMHSRSKMLNISKRTISSLQYHQSKYASIIREENGVVRSGFLVKESAIEMIENSTSSLKTDCNSLSSCMERAREMLKNCPGVYFNKTVILMTDDKFGKEKEKLQVEARRIRKEGFRLLCVGIGFTPEKNELEAMTTGNVIMYYDHPIFPETLEATIKELKNEINGKSIFERYVQYFRTPYFIFMRDTLSYLALLFLHFGVCLWPSTLDFTVLEWLIFTFFVGRLMMELYQASVEVRLGAKLKKQSIKSAKIDLSKYFSDWWNGIDLVTLFVYVIIVILRTVVYFVHSTVSNNRLLAIAGYLYGLNTMFLTLRVFGHIMESSKNTGRIQIALFQIIGAVIAIFGQFVATLLAFSFAITKVYVVEISYKAMDNSTAHGFCENNEDGMPCWWRSLLHLVWSLLGIADLDPLKSSDGPSNILAQLLYGLFLIMAVVMMMNMMIALLSNTYQHVEDNAFYEWSFRKAATIQTYKNYHPIPVPYNIISLPYLFFRDILRKKCSKQNSENQNPEEEEPVLHFTADFLQHEYSRKHGMAFPMSGTNKLESVFKETEGNRELMGLIAGHVFKYKESEVQQLRTDMKSQVDPHLSLWESVGVEIKGHQLIYLGEPYEPLFSQPLLSSLGAIFRIPLTKKWPGFEVVIQNTGPEYCVAIGVLTTTRVSSQSSGFGGLQPDAGFVADRGLIFDMNRSTWDDNKECEEYVAKRGDLIGCKVLFDCQSNDGILPMSITLNSRVIGKAEIRPGGKDLFPFVSFGNEGTTVLFKLCPSSEEQFAHTDVLSEEISDLKSEISELRSTMKVLLDALAASKKGN